MQEPNHLFCQSCESAIEKQEQRPICKGCFQNLKKLLARPVAIGPTEAVLMGLAYGFADFLGHLGDTLAVSIKEETAKLNQAKQNLKDKRGPKN